MAAIGARAGADASDPGRPVVVIGSANVDVTVTTTRLPRPGETALGERAMIGLGGKGANQAVAAALNGADTRFVARVGDDEFGRMVLGGLAARGVGTRDIRVLSGTSTGMAAITVDDEGQNCIVVVPGANARLSPADVEGIRPLIASAAVVVLQCEIPLDTISCALTIAANSGVPVILNPAPARGLDLPLLGSRIAYLIPNETEAADLAGLPVTNPEDATVCARSLLGSGVGCLIITLGAQGCVVADRSAARHVAAPPVHTVDTTGAGDAFVGSFAAALAQGCPRDEAIDRALAYASLSTTRPGAQASYADRETFEAMLGTRDLPTHR